MFIQLVEIPPPVPVVSTIPIVNDRRDPDGIEAHPVNVIKVIDQPSIASTAIVSEVAATLSGTIIASESICQQLID